MHELRILFPEKYLYQGAPGQVLHFSEKGMQMENMPLTAKDALALWDSGKPVPAFQVETAPERQTEVYAAAFELIRDGLTTPADEFWARLDTDSEHSLSFRERDVALSIGTVALQSGWAKMVSQHIHRDSPAITVRKPKE
jgi:hypothetical protein